MNPGGVARKLGGINPPPPEGGVGNSLHKARAEASAYSMCKKSKRTKLKQLQSGSLRQRRDSLRRLLMEYQGLVTVHCRLFLLTIENVHFCKNFRLLST